MHKLKIDLPPDPGPVRLQIDVLLGTCKGRILATQVRSISFPLMQSLRSPDWVWPQNSWALCGKGKPNNRLGEVQEHGSGALALPGWLGAPPPPAQIDLYSS